MGFQVSPLAKLPTAQIVDLRRGTWPGSLLPRPPACQKDFFDKLSAGENAVFYVGREELDEWAGLFEVPTEEELT